MNTLNYYYFNKKEKVIINESANDILSEKVNPNIVLGLAANLDKWGYYLDTDCIEKLFTMSEKGVVDFYNEIKEIVKEIKGDDVDHNNVLFKNFPDSCRSIDINKLSTARFISYYASFIDRYFGTDFVNEINWDGEVVERKEAKHDNLRKISLGSEDDFCKMCNNMLSGRMSLSNFDKEIIEYAINNFDQEKIVPEKIPFKENLVFMIKESMDGKIKYDFEFKTFTDFIRTCVALSDGDISLSTKPMIRSFDKQERQFLLDKLNKAAEKYPEDFTESLKTKRNKRFLYNIVEKGWHIRENNKQYPMFAKSIKESKKEYSYMSLAEQSLEKGNYVLAAKYYIQKSPGDFMRRVNNLLCKSNPEEKEEIIKLIQDVAKFVSPAVLINLKSAIKIDNKTKTAFIKGNTAKPHAFENDKFLDKETIDKVSKVIDEAIKEQFKNKKPLGNVYIDENLKNCPVPFAGRNDNGKNRSVERGTRLPKATDKRIIRAFCYKKNDQDGFYDLSATMLNDKFDMIQQVSWTQLKSTNSDKPIAVHSGDIARCSNGCTEFIDIDLDEIKNFQEEQDQHIRYIAFQVFAWNHVPFDKMERVFFGIMERDSMTNDKITKEDLKILKENNIDIIGNHTRGLYYYQVPPKGLKLVKDYKQEAIFDPATVEYRFDLTGSSLCKVPLIYDCEEEKFIFTDLDAMTGNPFIQASDKRKEESNVPYDIIYKNFNSKALLVEDFVGPVAAACNAVVNIEKPNLYDLFTLIAESTNSNIVDNIDEADIIMSVDKIDTEKPNITPFDRDVIVADFLTPPSSKQNIEKIQL